MRDFLADTIEKSSAANRASLDETKKDILAALNLKLDPVVKDVAELKGK